MGSVGERVARPDSLDKITGSARYIDDLSFGGMLFAAVVRSPHAHARIRKVSLSRTRGMKGVRAVLTAHEIRGANLIPMIQQDQPMLARDEVRHIGEAVVLVAAETRQQAEEAARAVRVDYEELPAILSIEEGFKKGEIEARVDAKLDAIEGRIDRKIVELHRQLAEMRDRELRHRLRVLKITLIFTALVALLSLVYKWVSVHWLT